MADIFRSRGLQGVLHGLEARATLSSTLSMIGGTGILPVPLRGCETRSSIPGVERVSTSPQSFRGTRSLSRRGTGCLVRMRTGLCALLLAAVFGHTASAASVRDVRHITTPGMTRLIVEVSAPVHYRIEALAPRAAADVPARVYVDLFGVQLDDARRLAAQIAEGPLERVRAAPHGAGARLILDVPGLRQWQAFPMSDPFRLVIDLHGRPRRAVRPSPPPAGRPSAAAAVARAAPAPLPAAAPPVAVASAAPAVTPRHHVKIVIDAGHGGKDPGAFGVGGLAEKDVTLAVAKRLQVRLRDDPEIEAVLTRQTDVFLTLRERTQRANAEGADLFVSIHANASPNPKLAGAETYYLNNTDDRATLRLAGMENGWRSTRGAAAHPYDVSLILSDLVQNYKVEESVKLAGVLQDGLVGELAAAGTPVGDLGVKQGPFYVLVGAAMPCVLVEVSFLTNPAEGALLGRASYQEAIAAGLLRGIRRFVEKTQIVENL
jgi:N-acetylmuramoyl-L-alanine amidase